MQIKAQPIDIINQKLMKIRCCTGCLNNINYLVFGHGLYCSSCLSTLPELTPDHFVNLQSLSELLVQAIWQYKQRSNGQASQLALIRGETENIKKQVKKSKDSLSFDLKSVKDKSLATLDELFSECLKQNQNQALQAFYEPDITATLILNESQLLLKNLNNLRVQVQENGTINYSLKEGYKKPQAINKKVSKEYKQLNKCIQSSMIQCQGIISNFLSQIRENE